MAFADLLAKERTIAGAGFNRWLVPPAALAIHLCIGMAYGFSVFWKPLGNALIGDDGAPLASCAAGATTFAEKLAGTGRALFATDCNWTQFDLGWMYTLFFVVLGCAAAVWGGWLERAGPRKAGFVSAICWCGGLLISALGVYKHQLWMMWLGSGVIGGIGLGLTVGAGTCGRAVFSTVATSLYDSVGPVGPALAGTALAVLTVAAITAYARSAR
jgi:MFS family permease